MQNFEYYTPTRVVLGKDTEKEAGRLVRMAGGTKALLHYGGGSVVKSGLLARIEESLKEAGVAYVVLGGVVPNPRMGKVYEGLELCRKEKVDFILAVGGGSVIDSAKAIAFGAATGRDPWDFYSGKAQADACLPIGAVLTIAAAGSEMSHSSVLTNEDGWLKRGYVNDICRPRFAIMNPALTYTLPPYQTASGCVDILMHTMERYFTKDKETELRDSIAEALMRTVIHYARVLKSQPQDYNARAQVMWAGSLAHNDLTGPRSVGDWACHQLEHELSGIYDVAHGAGLAAIWGSWARYVYKEDAARFAQFAVNVLGVVNNFDQPEVTALEGIEAMEEFFRSIDMPVSIRDMGIELTDEDIEKLAYKCCFEGKRTIGGFKVLQEEDMAKIYAMAK